MMGTQDAADNCIENQKHLVVGLLAHVDAGKTTLAEALLYSSGQLRKLGRVDHQDAFLDTDAMERKRGITIFSKQAQLAFQDMHLTLLDTPGHVDFSAEMERTLQVLDAAILVISGADGVQGHTETLWRLLERYQIPTFLFINKMDQPDTNKEKLMRQLQSRLGDGCIAFSDAQGNLLSGDAQELCEQLSVCAEELLEEYLEEGSLSQDSIVDAIATRQVFPCFFGSALRVEGVDTLLRGFADYAPIPEYPEDFGARIFKITRDEAGKRLTHMKVTGGRLSAKQMLSDLEEKADQLRRYDGVKYEAISEACAGEIVTVTGLTDTYAGQALGCEKENGQNLPILEPVLRYALYLPEGVDPAQALPKLHQLEEEEPELHILWVEEHKEIHVQVMGEVQTEILKNQLFERYGYEVTFGPGKIIYKETLAEPSYGIGHFEPLRHYAEVQLLLEPGEPGSGISFASMCSEDVLDKNWQRLIQTHVEEVLHPGVLTGSEVTDLRVCLVTGRAHPKHTEGGDFRQATYRAIRNGLRKGKNILLEPLFAFRMELPTEYLGRAMTDIERGGGHMDAPENSEDGSMAFLTGTVPVEAFWDYQRELAAYTAGRGQMSCQLGGFAPCRNSEAVIQDRGYDPEADLRRPTGSVFCAHGAGFQVPWDEVASYAHMECPLDLGEMGTRPAEESQKQSRIASVSQSISLEEIDAILAGTFRKQEGPSGRYKRYHKNSTRRVVGAADGNTSGSHHKTPSVKKDKMLLVDGYNVIFAWEELAALAEKNIDSARDRLMDICCDYQGFFGGSLILVFDAYKVAGGVRHEEKFHNIYVVYTKEAETADAYIERTTHTLASLYDITVATSDRLEQMIIWGNGASRMSSREFELEVKKSHERMREGLLDKDNRLDNRPFANLKLEGQDNG